ncbi:hypothetical protein Scep_011087 [Stephania cephalantha]|uniref:Mitochondrial glycoprotein n=1 Tax=Stephania cephalantha TaxID=152367 RepID=A0AAP0JWL4_9MAGN
MPVVSSLPSPSKGGNPSSSAKKVEKYTGLICKIDNGDKMFREKILAIKHMKILFPTGYWSARLNPGRKTTQNRVVRIFVQNHQAPYLRTLQDVSDFVTRKYQDEVIKVEVHMTSLVTGNHEGGGDDDEEDSSKGGNSSIPLVVSVVKGNGQFLEFGVTAYADEIAIESLSVKDSNASQDDIPYEGPDFGSLDENLQRAFHKYLEIRGIKPSTTNFLHEYMINKDSREYLVWLKNLKKFIEK